jgi:hypothetical protein
MKEQVQAAGRFRLLGPEGGELEASDALFEPLADSLLVHPRQGAPLRVDFAEVDAFAQGDHVAWLQLAGGEKVELTKLGRRFTEVASLVGEALSAYQARNLLLEEPVGGEPFACEVQRADSPSPAPATARVFATSLAVLPRLGVPFSVPFGEVTRVSFDEGRYCVDLAMARLFGGGLSLLKLGKQSQPCLRLLEERLGGLRARTAQALASLAPQLGSFAARRLAQAMPDGVPARRADVDAVAPGLFEMLLAAAARSPRLRESCDALARLCPGEEVAIGIKETNARQDLEEEAEEEGAEPESAPAEGPMEGRAVWLAFPIVSQDRRRPGNAVAVEVVTRSGRATYLFRVAPPEVYRAASFEELVSAAREQIRTVSRALALLSFKREPIYLSEEKIRSGAFARYRLALRLSEPLKAVRAAFVGRAIHTDTWNEQLEAALERARG